MSHSSADRSWVSWLSKNILAIGICPYTFEHDVQPGRVLSEKTETMIRMSDAVIVFLTQHSRFSAYVQQEIGYAAAQKKLIIPLVQQGLGSDALAMLNGKEYIQFDSRDPRGALDPLMDRLRQLSATKQVQQTQQSNAVLFALGLAIVLALASD